MTQTIYGVTYVELFRLISAFMAIRTPSIRLKFLELVESWAQEQWLAVDDAKKQT